MPIVRPEEMNFDNKKFSMIIYGSPGVGKTTLALSAPKPVLIDFDDGVFRVKAYHRSITIVCTTYEEVLQDLKSPEIASCETIIIDTGGSFINYLKDWAIRSNPSVNKQKNGSISLKGFGAVKTEFNNFVATVRDIMKKNVIFVFHTDEKADKDGNPQQRLMCEGAAKNTVWTSCDFGGYMQMIGNKRVISFTPDQEFIAKGCHGIEGTFNVPNKGADEKNDFLTQLFDKAKSNITQENEVFAPLREKYDTAIKQAKEILDSVTDVASLNGAVNVIQALDHALTSKKESSVMIKDKANALGFIWDREQKMYIDVKGEE